MAFGGMCGRPAGWQWSSQRTFGARSHRDHVGRLLREAVWSRQHPIERATQRNEAAIQQWSEQRWPARKKAEEDKGTINGAR